MIKIYVNMDGKKQIETALISVFHKDGLEDIVRLLQQKGIKIYSTGGTEEFIKKQGVEVQNVENLTSFPSILGGRVKTLHPKVFGGILARRDEEDDTQQLEEYEIPEIDLVIVDLYPFEETVASGADNQDIIEKIDIGGISLIRAAAKNFKDVLTVSSKNQYPFLLDILQKQEAESALEQRKQMAAEAFQLSSHYDTAIFNYFNETEDKESFDRNFTGAKKLRYGENPHQKGTFYGDIDQLFKQLHGKELSYNNLLDIDAAMNLMNDFSDKKPTIAVLKHNNACGIAVRENYLQAWKDALAGDPVSAFGGIIISNGTITKEVAEEINKIFYEVVIAPDFDKGALEILESKKNRIVLKQKSKLNTDEVFRTALNGVLVQEKDLSVEVKDDLKLVTNETASEELKADLLMANKIVKHTKSNAIVFVKNNQLLASGTGQTSRVDALNQAIEKAKHFNFDLEGAVMASDAFFPFPDCVEIAHKEGVNTIVQPGGSIKDKLSIDYCNKNNCSMFFTGIRHFKH